MDKNKEKLGRYLEELTYGMEYKILDESKDKNELLQIAEKFNLSVPSRDFAIFKGVYAFVDEENLNGCTLPKEEVAKALSTLNGKPVDFDHFRRRVVGFWIEAKIIDKKIIGYGVFYKSNFPDDFEIITELLNEGNLKISMEAWGNKVEKGANSYDLVNIEFAGGALLINTKPAFGKKAEVLEMAKKSPKVLEFASVMTAPESYIRGDEEFASILSKSKDYFERSQFSVYDTDMMLRLLAEIACPGCSEKYSQDVNAIDYTNATMDTNCVFCGAKSKVTMMPSAEMTKKPGKSKTPKYSQIEKIELITKKDKSSVTKSEDDSKDKKAIKELEEHNKMDEKITQLTQELANLKAEKVNTDREIASLKEKLTASETKVSDLSTKLTASEAKVVAVEAKVEETKTQAETEKAEAIKTAKLEATKIAERRAELGEEFAKDLTDEQILNDDKFENAKLKKENASLKKGEKKQEKAGVVVVKEEKKLDMGSATTQPIVFQSQKRVSGMAFGKDKIKEQE